MSDSSRYQEAFYQSQFLKSSSIPLYWPTCIKALLFSVFHRTPCPTKRTSCLSSTPIWSSFCIADTTWWYNSLLPTQKNVIHMKTSDPTDKLPMRGASCDWICQRVYSLFYLLNKCQTALVCQSIVHLYLVFRVKHNNIGQLSWESCHSCAMMCPTDSTIVWEHQ